MATKGELVTLAFDELAISGVTRKPKPEEQMLAIKQMDRMVGQWRNKGLCLGYADSAGSVDTNQESNLTLEQEQAVALNLALRLCPAFGLQPNIITMGDAKEAYQNLFPVELTMREGDPYMPTGSGGDFYRNQYGWCHNNFESYEINPPVGCETHKLRVGEVKFVTIDFTEYLGQVSGQVIRTHTLDTITGVTVISSSRVNNDTAIKLKVEGKEKGVHTIKLTVKTTGDERTLPENIIFDVQ